MNILLLEDDPTLSLEIKTFLKAHSFECDCIYDGSLVKKQYALKKYDLLILDINVPGVMIAQFPTPYFFSMTNVS